MLIEPRKRRSSIICILYEQCKKHCKKQEQGASRKDPRRVEVKDKFQKFLAGRYCRFSDIKIWHRFFLDVERHIFFLWVLINLGDVPMVGEFDPYPFNFLTIAVSLEAIFLAIIVLISQNRQSRNADIREQIDFEVNVRAEEEISKVLLFQEKIARQLNIPIVHDAEMEEMEDHTDLKRIFEEVERDHMN